MYSPFTNHGLFHGSHHGFLGNHSTASALIQLYDMWLSAAEKKELSAALLLDLTTAFDIVDHNIFLKKLKAYNFSENSILWFWKNRYRFFKWKQYSEPELLNDFAVPQGSILGPLIFLIFNNNFPARRETVFYTRMMIQTMYMLKMLRSSIMCSGSKTTALLRNSLLNDDNANIEITVGQP